MQSQFVVPQALALGFGSFTKKLISRDLKLEALKEKKRMNLYGLCHEYNYDSKLISNYALPLIEEVRGVFSIKILRISLSLIFIICLNPLAILE